MRAVQRAVATFLGPALDVNDASFAYRNQDATQILALRDVNLSVRRDQFVSVIGQSGCGKSTLLQLLAGRMARSRGTVASSGCEIRIGAPPYRIPNQ